jgi:hypothetical protein
VPNYDQIWSKFGQIRQVTTSTLALSFGCTDRQATLAGRSGPFVVGA